jgi:hypothetical protein
VFGSYWGKVLGGEWNGREEMLTPGLAKDFLYYTAQYHPTNVELLTQSTSSDCWLIQVLIMESNEQSSLRDSPY